MNASLPAEKQISIMETAWKKGCYPYAIYWSRRNADAHEVDYSARYKKCIQAKYVCRDAAFYWKDFKLAKQALDEYCKYIKDDEQHRLKFEIEVREKEASALQQLENGDPYAPQLFPVLVSSYPKERPNNERFVKAVEDLQGLQYHHQQVLSASTFPQFTDRVHHGIQAVERSVWTQYTKQVKSEWFDHFDGLVLTVKHTVQNHLDQADFDQAEQAFLAFEQQYKALLQVLNPPHFNEDLHDNIVQAKETWEELNQDIADAIQNCRLDIAEDTIHEYEDVFPKDKNSITFVNQLKKRVEQSEAVIVKLNGFKSSNRWKDAKSYLKINQKNIPQQKVPEYAQWIEQCQKRTFAFNTAAVVFILAAVLTVTYWYLSTR